ncbi:MAG TPA: nitroreductase/quinone reductase family protein [Candidatus Saccharimonadales bacterium]|nr:nitroreductase/quinone reductase family protein [Candidatus Saccharimonadales bacterium]
MAFRPTDLHDLDVAREVRIETHRPDDNVQSTVIWIVVDDGDVFVRSVHGEAARWYQQAIANPDVTIDDSGRRLEARAVPVHDADSIRRINEALKPKYTGDDGFESMFEPAALLANFRLEPRFPDEVPLEAPAFLGADEPSELGPPIEVGLLDAGPAIDENILLQPHKPV